VLQPVQGALVVELDPRRVLEGVVLPDHLDEAAVAGRAGIGGDDAVVGTLDGALTAEAQLDGHAGS
jgi:hypothetical protein